MTMKNFTRWICDLCGKVEEDPPTPKDWRWFREGMGPVRHACYACKPPPQSVNAPLGQEASR